MKKILAGILAINTFLIGCNKITAFESPGGHKDGSVTTFELGHGKKMAIYPDTDNTGKWKATITDCSYKKTYTIIWGNGISLSSIRDGSWLSRHHMEMGNSHLYIGPCVLRGGGNNSSSTSVTCDTKKFSICNRPECREYRLICKYCKWFCPNWECAKHCNCGCKSHIVMCPGCHACPYCQKPCKQCCGCVVMRCASCKTTIEDCNWKARNLICSNCGRKDPEVIVRGVKKV
ncbi:hypothetical protein [Cardinium endosymbiont of Culicoides punctatus]|uniref:hypothetical protein n=1 Tax=Cardinium endosymbiont of Culicoides punctatus TaxID=2304601 RepID=UPI001058EE79|nr:hypothetical protein [Cardinium endosymbiont of Culicoides punctatus]TDG95189.1 hypothetical protein CCPUN_06100 [Cardinium endosymbiont of Culicoides punctatus]